MNEKRMQRELNLKYVPDRYTSREAAIRALPRYVKPQRVIYIADNPKGLTRGFYVACPADAEKIMRNFKIEI